MWPNSYSLAANMCKSRDIAGTLQKAVGNGRLSGPSRVLSALDFPVGITEEILSLRMRVVSENGKFSKNQISF